jgi:GT2 family glycosyltransferase
MDKLIGKQNKSIDLSICIVNWNTMSVLRDCLNSIYVYTKKIVFEIIVVDSNSSDDSVKMVKSEFPECIIIALSKNDGFVKGNNIAFLHSIGTYICMLNPDTKIYCDVFSTFKEFMDKHTGYTAVGPMLVNQDGSIQYPCARTFPSAWNQLCLLLMLNKLFKKTPFFTTVELTYWDHKDTRDIDCISGACIFMRRDFIKNNGGLDEEIFMYAEDVDLCWRILKSGGKIKYLSDKKVLHIGGASSKQLKKNIFSSLMQRKSNLYIIKKHRGLIHSWLYRLTVIIGSGIRVLVSIAFLIIYFILGNNKHQYFWEINVKYYHLLLWGLGLENAKIEKEKPV